jgi:DNA-binding transcriptional LysR family regulator
MNIEELRTFVEVANAGGITPAAQRLGISKSVVSRRLARLEADLGTQLLLRTTRGAALTEAGAIFREHAAKVAGEIDAARETISPTGDLTGRLRVAVPLTFGPSHFAPVFAEMAKRHPQLHIQTCYSDSFVDLLSGGFDCAIRIGALEDSALIARRVGPLSASLFASPEYLKTRGAPETPEHLVEHEAVLLGTEAWYLTGKGQVVAVRPQGRFKADNGPALLAATLAGIGIGRLFDNLADEHVAAGALARVLTSYPPLPSAINVVRLPSQNPARKVRVLTELLIERFRADPHLTESPLFSDRRPLIERVPPQTRTAIAA